MFAFNKKLFLFLILISVLLDVGYAQYVPSKERGDIRFRRFAHMEGNQIRTTVFNYGMTGRESGAFPISVQTPYEWPKNTGQIYLAVAGIVVGGEVVDDNGDTLHIISRCHYLQSPQGLTWNFEPIGGYFNEQNPEGFATSNDPNTWPSSWPDKLVDPIDPGWPGSWNGYFGKNVFNADQEMFFKASDNNYDRYPFYFPDSTDLTRKGLGIILDTRLMAWSQILVQDALFLLFKIKNDGTKPINKVGVTITWADFVGETGQDDITEYDILNDMIWSRDDNNQGQGSSGNYIAGIIGGAFLETPGNAIDRIDNDGDGEDFGPKITEAMLVGESDTLTVPRNDPRRTDGIDNNGNGLIDENLTHVAFGNQEGVTYADRIDQNGNAENGSPIVTQEMVNQSSGDPWKRWPADPGNDPLQNGMVHLIMVESDDIGKAFTDFVDDDNDGEESSPSVTQEMINTASSDAPYFRYKVPGTNIILYDIKADDLGKKYADGVDNNNDGAVDEFMDEGIDEMVDEARNNGIDDDGDWNPSTDDVGLDGLAETGDPGENDGKPTPGRFDLPGEPNIDVTDVSETDQIGITGSFYRPSSEGLTDQYTDEFVWSNFMVPGNFFDATLAVASESNLFASSGLFPLQPGQTEPISLGIILANGPALDPEGQIRKDAVLDKKEDAQETYNNDYQFANAPLIPKLTAIPGDNKVTLYWDDVAESTFDRYIDKIGGIGNDFEGYRIYRASDPAFLDAKVITNAQGSPTFLLPIAQFDLEDGIFGYDSVGYQGVHFNLGNDSGLVHSWVDNSVKNGFTYYYAIASYDFGYTTGGIAPAECKISLSLNPDGSVKTLGKNVVQVTPEAPAAGYVSPTLGTIELVQGYTTSKILYDVIDPNEIKEGHVYYITFEDTIKQGTSTDTLTTKNYTLIDSTANLTLIDKSTEFGSDVEGAIIDGFKLTLLNDSRVTLDTIRSRWSDPSITKFILQKYTPPRGTVKGEERPNDYLIIFGDVGLGTSTEFTYQALTGPQVFPSIPVNFKVYNKSTQNFIDFAFLEYDFSGPQANGWFSGGNLKDRIVFLETKGSDTTLLPTWWFYLANSSTGYTLPEPGDTAFISVFKPFLSTDVFRFVSKKGSINTEQAKADLEKIKVVPNPYLANALWEQKNPYTSGRGPRSIHFTHLPNKCTIRIFTVSGELVKEIEHESNLMDGSAEWNLLTKDNLSASYGVYIYHIDAPGIGKTVGKFAIIK
ncbi:MAG: hypothetical protein A2W11_07440 [Ignavibacteria bacterium RBG_16_35_7]|nr:MAG: hypothetical protein A2W11_07440 [Ignavibacteria bacterium RBG_16_35_7]